jgi:antitoxin HigA-1
VAAKTKLLEPIHPGEILYEEFMRPLGISINRLARDLHVPEIAKNVHRRDAA